MKASDLRKFRTNTKVYEPNNSKNGKRISQELILNTGLNEEAEAGSAEAEGEGFNMRV